VVSARGGQGYESGGAGTICTKRDADAFASVLVDNGTNAGLTRLNSSLWPAGVVFDLSIAGSSIVIPDSPQTFRNLVVSDNAVVKHDPGQTGFRWTCLGNALIASNASFNADGLGYAANSGPGTGSMSVYGYGSGAGHGGIGGDGFNGGSAWAYGGGVYGANDAPVTLGSGGGGGNGSSGGGAIQFIVLGLFQLDGAMTANGLTSGYASGGGAGGSLWISAGVLSGAGALRAQGGAAATSGAAGGGGRIAIYARSIANYSGVVSVTGANPGTVFMSDSPIPYLPHITSVTNANGRVGLPFTYQIAALYSPTIFGAAGLPSGLGVNTNTGLISGTPQTAGNFTIELSAGNSAGTNYSSLALVIAAQPFLAQTNILQPGPGANDGTDDGSPTKGKDASARYSGSAAASPYFYLYNSPCNVGYCPGYIQFSTNFMSSQGVTNAQIQFYCKMYFNGSGWAWTARAYQINLRRVTAPWNELTLPASVASTPIATSTVTAVGGSTPGFVEFEGWLSFDVTSLYQDWATGAAANYGVQIAIDTQYCANGDEFIVYTSDNSDATLHPKLVALSGTALPSIKIAPEGSALRLTWNTTSNLQYQVETSSTLTNWSPLGVPVLGQSGLTNVLVPMTNSPAFFRVGAQ
jgi:hypothetical protein